MPRNKPDHVFFLAGPLPGIREGVIFDLNTGNAMICLGVPREGKEWDKVLFASMPQNTDHLPRTEILEM